MLAIRVPLRAEMKIIRILTLRVISDTRDIIKLIALKRANEFWNSAVSGSGTMERKLQI